LARTGTNYSSLINSPLLVKFFLMVLMGLFISAATANSAEFSARKLENILWRTRQEELT